MGKDLQHRHSAGHDHDHDHELEKIYLNGPEPGNEPEGSQLADESGKGLPPFLRYLVLAGQVTIGCVHVILVHSSKVRLTLRTHLLWCLPACLCVTR